jgi:hypothetical protein
VTQLKAARGVHLTMRSFSVVALLTLALAATAPLAAGQAGVPGATIDPGITNGSKQARLDSARKTWNAAHVDSYSYVVKLSCYCGEQPDVKVVVRRGRLAAGTPKDMLDVATVPRLFRTIQRSIDRKVAAIRMTYGKRGVPSAISIDVDARIADEESYYTIKRFTRL